MKTGDLGTFVISWLQTEIDALTGGSVGAIQIGSTWRWTGRAVRVDDPRDVLLLVGSENVDEMHRRAALQVRKISGDRNFPPLKSRDQQAPQPLFSSGFDVTDGHRRYRATLVDTAGSHHPMLLFNGLLPPVDRDLWVVSHKTDKFTTAATAHRQSSGTICFVPGTRIDTPGGQAPVEDIAAGDRISTCDNGPQTVRWVGRRYISGGRFQAMPQLRPIRMRADFFGSGEPDGDLLLSPDHRIIIKGAAAQALFNTSEVLVRARDLINDSTVMFDHALRDVMYIHLMFENHQIVRANGVACESFHPANAELEQIETGQRLAMLEQFPTIADDPHGYGEFARRNLTTGEAAILSYDRLSGH